ncbi:MAG: rod shape-determining protein MreD [Peptococcaceae bacterium]|nr:rod shape-determining protein MreD [Peptococcaceae bacterium]
MAVIFIFCLIAPGTVFYYLSPWGIRPDLMMIFIICFSLYSRVRPALALAFVTGVLTDLYIGSNLGLYTFTLCCVVLVSIRLQKGWEKEGRALVTGLVFAATFVGQGVMALLAALSGFGWSLGEGVKMVCGVAVYNALLVLLIYPWVRRFFWEGRGWKGTRY